MNVLIVEDDDSYIEIFTSELAPPKYEVTIAKSRQSALLALSASYELVVCDLKIPSSDDALDADTSHGMAVLAEVARTYPGTPIVAFSAFGTIPILQELLAQGRHGDYLGIGEQRELLKFLQKDELSACLDHIASLERSFADLADIEVATSGAQLHLTDDEERVIRLFSRRMGGTLVHVRALDGGRSASRVLGIRLDSPRGHVSSVVAKVGDIDSVRDEKNRIDTYVAGALPVGSFPAVANVIEAGAGRTGGIFFQVAGYDNHLLDVIESDPPNASSCVQRVASNMEVWRDGVGLDRRTVGDIRRAVTPDDELRAEQTAALNESVEAVQVHARWCIQHNDLHVFNVLVASEDNGILIDFANVAQAPASFDPITLELSVAFHSAAYAKFPGWPTADDGAHWSDLDEYVARCPYPEFVKSCRKWAHETAAGDGEVWACVYAYIISQLRFDTCPQPFASALLEHVVARLMSL